MWSKIPNSDLNFPKEFVAKKKLLLNQLQTGAGFFCEAPRLIGLAPCQKNELYFIALSLGRSDDYLHEWAILNALSLFAQWVVLQIWPPSQVMDLNELEFQMTAQKYTFFVKSGIELITRISWGAFGRAV